MNEIEQFILGLSDTELALLIGGVVLLALWDLAWKAVAMWEAAKERDKLWFVLLLLINSIGIVPILYLWYRGKLFGGGEERSIEDTNAKRNV